MIFLKDVETARVGSGKNFLMKSSRTPLMLVTGKGFNNDWDVLCNITQATAQRKAFVYYIINNLNMNYYIDLFSPETAKAFENSNKNVSGFRISRKTYVNNQKIGPGDKFICYVTRIRRFVGVLEVKSRPYQDNTPLFTKENDPFILRFKVEPMVWLPLEKVIPIHDDLIWNNLSFTKGLSKDSNKWTYMVFSSPRL